MRIACPHCGKTVAAPDKYAGKTVKCPGCQGPMQLPALPELGQSAPPPPAPAAPAPTRPAAAAPRPASAPRSAPPPARAPAPPPGPAPAPAGEEPAPAAAGEDLGPVADGEVDDRADTRRDSRRAPKPGRRAKRFQGDKHPAVQSYNRNMNIMGGVLLVTALWDAGIAIMCLIAYGALSRGIGMDSPGMPVSADARALVVSLALASVVFYGGFGLLSFLMAVCAFLKKHWVNWVVAILYGLFLPIVVLAVVLGGASGLELIGPGIVVVMFVLAILNIASRGRVKAALAGAPAGPAARLGRSRATGLRPSGAPVTGAGRTGSMVAGRPLSRRRR